LPDDYGVETRVGPITGLNGREGGGSLMQPLYKLPLFNRADGTPVALYQYNASEQLTALDAERKKARIEAGAIPFEDLEKELRASSRAMGRLLGEANAAHGAWQAMAALLDEKASEDPPSTSHVRDMLTQVAAIARRYAPAEVVAESAAAEAGGDEAGEAGTGGAGGTGVGAVGGFAVPQGQTVSREDALRALESIATFFRKTEPLSPLAYTLDDAIRRGRMTWPELLEEVVADRDSRNAILTSLGIRPPPEATEE
jgi:type VI secretion system protein ImpA